MSFLASWLRAFLFTQVVEMGVYTSATAPRPLRERLAIAFAASAITHPIVWFVIPDTVRALALTGDVMTDWWIAIAVAETFAFSAEAVWLGLFGVRPREAAARAFLANAFSFTLGLVLYRFGLWAS